MELTLSAHSDKFETNSMDDINSAIATSFEQEEPFDLSVKRNAIEAKATSNESEKKQDTTEDVGVTAEDSEDDEVDEEGSSYCDVTSVFTDIEDADDVTHASESKQDGASGGDDVASSRKMTLNFGIDNILDSHPTSRVFLENFQRIQQNLHNVQQEALRRSFAGELSQSPSPLTKKSFLLKLPFYNSFGTT